MNGRWFAVKQTDPRAVGLYKRHYSAQRGDRHHGITGPGETLTLLTSDARALYVWRLQHWLVGSDLRFLEGGVCCAVFRNEGAYLSSDLIREADALADVRWPTHSLHYTWVDPTKIRSTNPGYAFKMAGWVDTGFRSKHSKLVLLTRAAS